MSWWHPKITIVVRREPDLTETQLNLALAVDEANPIWRALHQLIDTAEANANEEAAEQIGEPYQTTAYVAGAKHLRVLREELVARRNAGLTLLGKSAEGKVNDRVSRRMERTSPSDLA